MLVINYNGNKPITDYFKFSVQGNNKSDVVRFLISLNQSGLVFNENYHYYAKVQCVDDDYYDKVRLEDIEFDDNNNLLKANFVLLAQHTSHKQIEVSLSCENLLSEVVWQTQIVKIAIANGVNADEEIEDKYPSVLQDLQNQIDHIGGGGGASDVVIEEIFLRHASKNQNHILKQDYISYDGGDLHYWCNDPENTWVCIKTSPINSLIETEIKEGRFVIRFNYPTNHRKRGFRYDIKDTMVEIKGVVFITEDMVKTNAYGEKYILFEERFDIFFQRFFTIENVDGRYNLTFTSMIGYTAINEALFNIKDNNIDGLTHFSGVPTMWETDNSNAYEYWGFGRSKLKASQSNGMPYQERWGGSYCDGSMSFQKSVNDLKHNFWCPLIADTTTDPFYSGYKIRSFAWRQKRGDNGNHNLIYVNGDEYDISYNSWHYCPMVSTKNADKTRRFLQRVSLRPSCAIIHKQYNILPPTQNRWLKTYSQSEQKINLGIRGYFKMDNPNEQKTYLVIVARIGITNK